jgi:hypothetical protein
MRGPWPADLCEVEPDGFCQYVWHDHRPKVYPRPAVRNVQPNEVIDPVAEGWS